MKHPAKVKDRVSIKHIYDAYSQHYDIFEGKLSRTTWQKGIIAEIRASGRTEGRVFDAGAGPGNGAK